MAMNIKDRTDDFFQNPDIKSDDDKSLDQATLKEFIEKYGEEQAIGYIRAVRHFEMELDFALYNPDPDSFVDRPVTRVRNNIIKLLEHKRNFLSFANEQPSPINKPAC